MKSKNLDKSEIKRHINKIFSSHPSNKEIKKAKKLAMSKNIKLGALKKKFCKKCYSLFDSDNSQIRIKQGFKIIKCKKCSHISRIKMN